MGDAINFSFSPATCGGEGLEKKREKIEEKKGEKKGENQKSKDLKYISRGEAYKKLGTNQHENCLSIVAVLNTFFGSRDVTRQTHGSLHLFKESNLDLR